MKRTSKYKGVWYDYRRGEEKWQAKFEINGDINHLGSFKTEKEAALSYCLAAELYWRTMITVLEKD